MNDPETIQEFLQRIEFLRLGIENELLRRKVNDIIDQMIDMEDNYLNQDE